MAAEGFYGYTLCRDGTQHEGMRRLWETLAVARAHHTDDSTAIEVAYTQIADCLRTMGDLEAAVAYYILAYDLVQQRNTTSHQLSRNASYIADMMCDAQRTAECVKFVEKAALHVSQMPAGEQQSNHAARLRSLQVRALIARGETEQAEALALESLQTTDCCEISLRWQLSVAQRANGKLGEAVRSADEALTLLRRQGRFERGEATLLVNRAAIEMSLGEAAQALATVESAMPAVLKNFPVADVIWGNAFLVQGQALLASGRPEEAIEPLRKAYGFWLGHDPKSIWAAEAEYWFGQAYLANGDGKRGRWMVAEARRALATSPYKMHRALAAGVTR
jgi:tetratricopeptide (TPR) repeat protein